MSGPSPSGKEDRKPPKRHWQPIEPFWNLKASHWVEVALTVALISVGVSQLIVYSRQARIMRGQLQVMSVDSTIHRAESAAVMHLSLNKTPVEDGWHITTQWDNVGKTNAVDYWGWNDLKVFHDAGEVNKFDFLSPIDEKVLKFTARSTVIPGDPVIYFSNRITMQDANDAMAGKAFPVAWGYIEYKDEFGTFYTVRFCSLFNFSRSGGGIVIKLPLMFRSDCNVRTEQTREQRNKQQ